MEGELRQLEERYRSLVEDLPGIAYVWDVLPGAEPRSFRYVSPRIQDILGFSPEEWQASARVHPHDVARVSEAVERSARTGEPFLMEYRYLAKDGSVVCVLDHASLMTRSDGGEPSSFHGVMLDITSRKEAESKAAAAEDRYRNLTERGPVVAYSYELTYADGEADPSLHVSYVSPQAEELVRYPVAHWLHDAAAWVGMVHPDDRERVVAITTRNWLTGEPWTSRYRIIRSDGTVIWLLDAGRLLDRDDLGRPRAFQGILLDITHDEETRAGLEAAAREQTSELDGALAIPWAETVQPDTGVERYTYIGPQALDILGYTPEELMVESTHFRRMVHPDDRARVQNSSKRSGVTGLWEETYRVLRRDGDIRWLHSYGRRTSAPGETPELWHGVAVDVTALRASTDRAMAAGIASERDPVAD
jgi:PAS domain S-box-containing protein